jgi:hypothetical protein
MILNSGRNDSALTADAYEAPVAPPEGSIDLRNDVHSFKGFRHRDVSLNRRRRPGRPGDDDLGNRAADAKDNKRQPAREQCEQQHWKDETRHRNRMVTASKAPDIVDRAS